MEIQFEQNRDFNQRHREDSSASDAKEENRGMPQGKEGSPKQRLVHSKALDPRESELDRRPSDVVRGKASGQGSKKSSAIAGIQSDQQNSTRNSRKPLGEDPNYNAEVENKEHEE